MPRQRNITSMQYPRIRARRSQGHRRHSRPVKEYEKCHVDVILIQGLLYRFALHDYASYTLCASLEAVASISSLLFVKVYNLLSL
jgi:hypothetical protein